MSLSSVLVLLQLALSLMASPNLTASQKIQATSFAASAISIAEEENVQNNQTTSSITLGNGDPAEHFGIKLSTSTPIPQVTPSVSIQVTPNQSLVVDPCANFIYQPGVTYNFITDSPWLPSKSCLPIGAKVWDGRSNNETWTGY